MKLYEELLMSEEGLKETNHDKIYIGKPTFESMEVLEKKLSELKDLLKEQNIDNIKDEMETIVSTYHREDVSVEVASE